VNELNLADLYQAANIPLDAKDLVPRRRAFAAVRASLTKTKLIHLARMYFGWWQKIANFEWFRDEFAKLDPDFSLVENRREASLLAGGLLLSALKSGEPIAGLVVLAASLNGQRSPTVPGISLETFETELKNLAAQPAKARWYSTDFEPLGKASTLAENPAVGGPVGATVEELRKALDETHEATKLAFNEVQILLKQMAGDLSQARQEVEILWWLAGGWSRRLERPFSELGTPLNAIAAGFDLADLSVATHGPYAAAAILTRALSGIKGPNKRVSLAQAGDSASPDEFLRLAVPRDMAVYPDICPLSAALATSAQIGKGDSWHMSFEQNAHVKTSVSLDLLDLAVQAMRERLIFEQEARTSYGDR
jgi:hypothetical protein